jgi:hypothetical protein
MISVSILPVETVGNLSVAKATQCRWYKRNCDRHLAKVMRRRRAAETDIIKLILVYLHAHPCVDCGQGDPVKLEFDHVKGLKTDAICNLIKRGLSWATIYEEIQKCEVRCCNCHRRKTARQFGYRKLLLDMTGWPDGK